MQATVVRQPAKIFSNTFLGCLLFVGVFVVFLPCVFNGFTNYDDTEYVTSNSHVQSGLSLDGLKWAFQTHGANWHPLTWLSHSLDCELFGLKPWGHHLVNILLHALNTALAFLSLVKLTGKSSRSFVMALLFGLHPLRVESVAWVAERKDVLSAFFFMSTLIAYTAYARENPAADSKNKQKHYALALFFFSLGLMSKSMLVTLPCVLLLLDFWPLNRFNSPSPTRLVWEKIPFFMLSLGMSLITYLTQFHGAALVTSLPLKIRLANALISYCRYLGKIFWPENLCAIYPYPTGWAAGTVCAAAILLFGITFMAIFLIRKSPFLLTGWLWFLGMLIPVIGIVQIGNQSMADRYTYLPSLGLFLMLVWGIADLTTKLRHRAALLGQTNMILICACVILTRRQISYWKDSESLFRRAYSVTKDNVLADVFLGSSLAERGDYKEAITLYHQAIELAPTYYDPHYDLGLALIPTGRAQEAINELQIAMKCRPNTADCHLNLGVALYLCGDITGAKEQFTEAMQLDASNVKAPINLGKIYLSEKNPDAAIREFQHALKLNDNDAEAHDNLGMALGAKGKLADAIEEFRLALKLDPHMSSASTNLARALQMKAQSNDTD